MRKLIFLLLVCVLVPSAAVMEEQTTISLSFAGDVTLGGHEGWMGYSIGTFKVMAQEQGDYGYFLKYAREIFEKDDFTFVNLEGVLADSGRGQNKSLKWNFRGVTEYVNILTLGSVEGVTLANNHSLDFGKIGLASTQETLDKAGILWAYHDQAVIYEKDGYKIAFIGYGETEFPRFKKGLKAQIDALKNDQGVHAVVFNYHGGRQYHPKHNKLQTENMRYAIDMGADLVIGHHPHVLQGLEIYKDRQIVYSLGNFAYGGNRKPRDIEYPSMVLGVDMTFDSLGFAGSRLTLHPYNISATKPRNNYQPYPVTGDLASEVMGMIQADTEYTLKPLVEGVGAVQAFVPAR